MPFPPNAGPGPMGGLKSAQPPAPQQPAAAPTPQDAVMVLKEAVARFGPQIVEILKQLLAQAGPAVGSAPPSGPGAAPTPPPGMMR